MNEEGGFQYNWDMAKILFGDKHNLSLWAPALGLAVILRIITTKYHHQLIFPMCRSLSSSPIFLPSLTDAPWP
jgi:SulP family sulfate permease